MENENNFYIPQATDSLLKQLSEQNKVSKLALIEILVSQAYNAKWTVLKPISAGSVTEGEEIDIELLENGLSQIALESMNEYLEKNSIRTWLQLGKQGAKKLGRLDGIGDYTVDTIRTLLEEHNVILGQ
ncbi:hypothetical protein HMJ29_06635 [Hymenobacter taeanensis]|uniref:Uncharacterized protein n=1 Tax=Hymenobacter taeanensis TaxID=2735321 RepID=A0A6M6BDQ2_9BACT|nr:MULTISPECIES: hypothetical protein [Hymenobacter]QJX46631.1 hypothetical protein HMJ29_06635 [Hymenobacter taeanensis]UOQ80494.1 hypothetical protein MUN83_16975 [Hymenobacter sp. 5414T-23]